MGVGIILSGAISGSLSEKELPAVAVLTTKQRRFVGGLLLCGGAAVASLAADRMSGRSKAATRYRYGPGYRETIRLRDGTFALLRTIRPTDKSLLMTEMNRLSPEARYWRFHTAKHRLTDEELRYLSEVDGVSHFAIGAVRVAGGHREGLGIARFVRLKEPPGDTATAEAALVVADRMRYRGLGRALLTRLMEAAQERGIRTMQMEVLATNTPMRGLLAKVAPGAAQFFDGGTVVYQIPLQGAERSAAAAADAKEQKA